jgi:hypothetical protein
MKAASPKPLAGSVHDSPTAQSAGTLGENNRRRLLNSNQASQNIRAPQEGFIEARQQMSNHFVTNEDDKTITHEPSGRVFNWTIIGRAVLAPCFDTAGDDVYISLLKEAERAGAESVQSSENREAFKNTLNYRKKYPKG